VRAFLFGCGALSIATTVGIVYELGKEALSFFANAQWENTNKLLAAPLNPSATVLLVGLEGRPVQMGETIRVHAEEMRIVGVDGNRITVERGWNGTPAESHEPGVALLAADRVNLVEFFTGTEWQPQLGKFGVLPLVNATLMTTAVAMLVALPLGLASAIYLSEYASRRLRQILKPVLEVLAGVPTVVYGYFALTFMTPLLRQIFGQDIVQIYNTASAGIVMGILILPLVCSMTEDALSAVPASLRHAAYALGATRMETAVRVVVPAALSGIAAAFLIGLSRAIGETMIVAIAAGAGPAFTFNPFESAETMTGHIVRISGGDLSYDSIDYNSIFAIALLLFLLTLGLNGISQRVVRRFREVYE
jgi:phosphate transport system permease protein